jgi:acyl CoA:acetate/3-ketoacid CoA transferase beta subunit
MALAAGARDVRLILAPTTRAGAPRLVEACSYPLTARGRAGRIYTDLAVVDVTPAGFVVREMVDGLSADDLTARSGAPLAYASDCKILAAPDL